MLKSQAVELVNLWVQEIPDFRTVSEEMRQALVPLLITHLTTIDVYAAEKLIKSFCEPIYYLQKLLLAEHSADTAEQYRVIRGEIEQQLISEVHRQHRHYATFLTAAQRRVRSVDVD